MCLGDNDRLPIDQTLEQLRSLLGGALADTLQPILKLNEKRGRIRRHLALDPQSSLQSYIVAMAARYQADCAFLQQIQQQKNTEAWELLLDKLRRWAYSFLSSWNLDDPTRILYTIEIAQEASLEIIHSHFPYDCEFDAWACTITQHVSSKYMQRQSPIDVIDDVDLSDAEEWFYTSTDHPTLSKLEREIAQKQALLDAIAQLSDKQKEAIWKHYFEGWTLSQIAAYLGISPSAVYKRHFDALKQLRKILGADWHKDE
jgi:RNA polymerase sigma factor (sigma-70 family)